MAAKQSESCRFPVSLRALIQRINRKLKPQDEMLKTLRGERCRNELGNYYIVDFNRNCILHKWIDPEALGRDLGVLHPWERLEDELDRLEAERPQPKGKG